MLDSSRSRPQDPSQQDDASDHVRLLAPVIVLVLGFTAIPVELRRFDPATLTLGLNTADLVRNVILYVPVGVVLTRLGLWRGVTIAALLSLFAESCQVFMMHRVPSPFDLAMNVVGAMIGLLVGSRCRVQLPSVRVNAWTGWLSLLAALTVLAALAPLAARAVVAIKARMERDNLSVNCRGATLPGSIEAHWTFDEIANGAIHDSSGNGLDGTLVGDPVLAEGIHGMAVRLDGETTYVDFGHPVDLRLMGSMTISAWINSRSFPRDDAAIVSTVSPGYQLDTTIDCGTRTIGFKFADSCGDVMVRYGATELRRDTWYHVGGVYDADARTMHVYLNGHLDDGILGGPVPAGQRTSSQPVCVGKRPDLPGYEFAGLIDDVQIYSRALKQVEIENAMNGVEIDSPATGKSAHAPAGEILEKRLKAHADRCYQPTQARDTLVPGLMVAMGVLSAMACAGFWPRHRLPGLGVSLAVGLLLVPAAAITLPWYAQWMLPVLSLAGGASIAVSSVAAIR
jgi:hypothetical protein